MKFKHLIALAIVAVGFVAFFPVMANASHSWGGYHWARTSNPFTLKLGDNVSPNWDSYLATTSTDWSKSSVLDTAIVAGGSRTPRKCNATSGRVEVCNATYGNNGWLGIAQIWISGSHITQAVSKMNDTYFNTSTYNTPAWRNLVLCQEVGHTLGLDHQDEDFNNPPLGTCMDYTSDPTPNQHPNAHDYEELEIIYSHLDSTTTVNQTKAQLAQILGSSVQEALGDSPKDWGKAIKDNGKVALFEKNLGEENKIFTFVIWAK